MVDSKTSLLSGTNSTMRVSSVVRTMDPMEGLRKVVLQAIPGFKVAWEGGGGGGEGGDNGASSAPSSPAHHPLLALSLYLQASLIRSYSE